MELEKVIAVVGATGAQGGGLCRAILDDPSRQFALRAITRKPDSPRAQELTSRGAEVVAADLDDMNSLKRAFAGAYGVFGVTNFWEHFSPETELRQARNMAEAAKAAGVRHFVWSTLEDTRKWVPLDSDRMPTLMGKYKVPHFDAKGEADAFFGELGVPTTFLRTSSYFENLIYSGLRPQRGPDGSLIISFPMDDKKLPGIAVEDIGRCAYGIFERGDEFIGKTVGIAGEHLTGEEMAAALTKAIREPVEFFPISPDAYRALGFPGAEDLGNMFQFKRDFNEDFCGVRSVAVSRELNPELQTFSQWLNRHASEIPIPEAAPA